MSTFNVSYIYLHMVQLLGVHTHLQVPSYFVDAFINQVAPYHFPHWSVQGWSRHVLDFITFQSKKKFHWEMKGVLSTWTTILYAGTLPLFQHFNSDNELQISFKIKQINIETVHGFHCILKHITSSFLLLTLPQSVLMRWLSFLAHLSWKLKWAFLITCRPSSVCPFVCP